MNEPQLFLATITIREHPDPLWVTVRSNSSDSARRCLLRFVRREEVVTSGAIVGRIGRELGRQPKSTEG